MTKTTLYDRNKMHHFGDFIELKVGYYVLDLQIYINKLSPNIQHLPKEERSKIRRTMRACDRVNKKFMKEISKILKTKRGDSGQVPS